MRSLPKSLLPILIASALLLSAASECRSDEKHRSQTGHHKTAGENQTANKSPVTIVVQPAPVQIIQPGPAAEKKETPEKWYQRPSVTDWGVLAITALYTGISIGLFLTTKNAARAAQRSADAAFQSAEAAKLSLKGDRPYLLSDDVKLSGFRPPTDREPDDATTLEQAFDRIGPLYASLRIRNYGKGPAIVLSIATRLTVSNQYPPIGDFSECIPADIGQSAIAAGEHRRIHSDWSDSYQMDAPGNFDDLMSAAKTLIFYGIIAYKDVFNERYETVFLYRFQPPQRENAKVLTALGWPSDRGHFDLGPERYNYSK